MWRHHMQSRLTRLVVLLSKSAVAGLVKAIYKILLTLVEGSLTISDSVHHRLLSIRLSSEFTRKLADLHRSGTLAT